HPGASTNSARNSSALAHVRTVRPIDSISQRSELRMAGSSSTIQTVTSGCIPHFARTDRQGKTKRGPTANVRSGPQAAAVSFDDPPADRETEAEAVLLRRKEGIEDLGRHGRWETLARVPDRHLDRSHFHQRRGHHDPALAALRLSHGL